MVANPTETPQSRDFGRMSVTNTVAVDRIAVIDTGPRVF